MTGTADTMTAEELTYPSDSVVVLAGVPGAGKSTLLDRLFPEHTDRVYDSGRLRDRWMPVFGVLPYPWWRPLLHLTYYAIVLNAMRTGPLVVHDCATRPWVRRLIGWRARQTGRTVHLLLLDVPDDLARDGQQARGRVVGKGSMATHCRRWPQLLDQAVADPAELIPGAASAIVLDRDQANRLEAISFR